MVIANKVLSVTAVKYQVMLGDGTMVAKTPEEGVEFYLKDGNLELRDRGSIVLMNVHNYFLLSWIFIIDCFDLFRSFLPCVV